MTSPLFEAGLSGAHDLANAVQTSYSRSWRKNLSPSSATRSL